MTLQDSRRPRQRRSRETRARILHAATALFVEKGYIDTAMAEIAAMSGVAVQSLYVRFGGKAEILAAVFDVAIVGDDDDRALLERAWFDDVEAAPDARAGIDAFMAEMEQLMARTYPLFAVVRSAGTHEVSGLLAVNKRQRAEGLRAVAGALAKKSGFRPDLSIDRTIDMLYAIASEDNYGLLVADRGWTSAEWSAWCSELLSHSLCSFPSKTSSRPGSNRAPKPRSTA